MRKLVEIAPNRWRFMREQTSPARSDLPLPYVISDTMDPTEQVDGKFYTSKSEFRATGKALGLIEVGNEKLPPRVRSSMQSGFKEKRRQILKTALEKVRAGHHERHFDPSNFGGRQRAAAAYDRGDDT
jgi:hypothetical protein